MGTDKEVIRQFKFATQSDIDTFLDSVLHDKNIYPYLSTSRYHAVREAKKDDWGGIQITDDKLSYLLVIGFDRADGMRFTIALFAKTTFAAGKGILVLKEMVNRYKPYCIDSTVAFSNEKSFKITTKILGNHWGIEPRGAWNILSGKFEDLYYFRKLMTYD